MCRKSNIRCGGLIYVVSFVFVLSLVLTGVSNAADSGLVGWWKFDEGEGTAANDSSGHNNHGSLRNGPRWIVPGLIGNASLRLDGSDDYVAIRNLHYNSSRYNEVSVSAWIRTDNSGNQVIASFDRSEYWRLEINGSGAGPGQVGWDVNTNAGIIDYGSNTRVDDGQWHHVVGVFDQGTLTIYIDGKPETPVSGGGNFGSSATRYGFIGVGSEASSFNGDKSPANYFDGDLDDVCIYDRAMSPAEIRELARSPKAGSPSPADGIKHEDASVILSWSPGKYAALHNVYLGTDSSNLPLVSANQTFDSNSYGPVVVELGKTYYWRVDEVNDAHPDSPWQGDVWSFEVKDYVLVDDFESYATSNELLLTWADGASNGTGSTVSLEDEFAGNSMKCAYDNSQRPFYSEADLTYDTARDWTRGGVKALELQFHYDVNNSNSPAQLYVALEDSTANSAILTYDNTNEPPQQSWQVWIIALQDFYDSGVDLTKIKKLIVGLSSRGGSGVVYIDDIRLYPPRCLPEYIITDFTGDCVTDYEELDVIVRHWLGGDYNVVAEEPDNNRLQAHYKFDETSGTAAYDSSGKGYHAIVDPNGANAWDAYGHDGYCLDFDGTFGVTIPSVVFSNISKQVSISVWVHIGTNVNPNTIGRVEFGAGPAGWNEYWDRLVWLQERPEDYIGRWSHYAFVKDANDGMMRIYHNGLLVAQNTEAFLPMIGAAAGPSRIGADLDGTDSYYKGKLDDLQIYDYALSHAQVLYLAHGSGSELYQPLQPVLSPVDPYGDGQINFRDFAALAEVWLEQQLWP